MVSLIGPRRPFWFFFFNDTATTEIYTLSLHDALPISVRLEKLSPGLIPLVSAGTASSAKGTPAEGAPAGVPLDRKSTRLNSSHLVISYAVFCLRKKTSSRSAT